MRSAGEQRVRFWRPELPAITGMLRVEHEDRLKTTYSEHFTVVVIYDGAFDGWYRGRVHTLVAGAIKLKEPGEVHRDLRVHAPFTLQGAGFSPEIVTAAAAALGLRGPVHFQAPASAPGERASRLAFAMHAALVRPDVPEIERATLRRRDARRDPRPTMPNEPRKRAPRAVRLARAFSARRARRQDHARRRSPITPGSTSFTSCARSAPRSALPPYEYLTHLRVARAPAAARAWRARRRGGAGGRLLRREPAASALPPHRRDHAGPLRAQLRRPRAKRANIAQAARARCATQSRHERTHPQ